MLHASRDVALMSVRMFPLAKQVDGINLMRSKGGASPESLFDLKNGWVTSKRTVESRPGSAKDLTFPAGTKGVIGFEGKFHTFAHAAVLNLDPRIVVNILVHPTAITPLLKIHKVFAFLGRLYVVAEFIDGLVKHFWVENPSDWVAGKSYDYRSAVQPVIKSGFYFENLTPSTIPAWQFNSTIVANDVRQPRVANGFKYTATAVTGTAPVKTGNTEPTWPVVAGQTVLERRYVTDVAQQPPGDTDASGGTPGAPDGGGGGGEEYGPFPEGQRKSTGLGDIA